MNRPQTVYWMISEADSKESDLTFWVSDWLSVRERNRLDSLRFEKRRREWMLGRMTCKLLLQHSEPACRWAGLPEIEIFNEEEGAPYAAHQGERVTGCITLSHRNGKALAAYSSDPTLVIGVDLETVEPRAESFLEDYFTSEEVLAAHRHNIINKDIWITIAWSVKESVLKVLRKGLRLDTRCVEIGNVEGIEEWGRQTGEWREVELKLVPGETVGWRAWWRIQDGLVQTFVLMDSHMKSPQVTLHEITAAILRLPDSKEWNE